MSRTWQIVAIIALAGGALARPAPAQWSWRTTEQWDVPTRAKTVEPVQQGGVTLVPYELIADEIGRSPNPANRALARERIKGKRCIRKEFLLEDATAAEARLCILAGRVGTKELTKLDVTVNGRPVTYQDRRTRVRPYDGVYPKGTPWAGQPYKSYWKGGWQEIPVPVKLLAKGINTVVVRARPGETWTTLIEPSLHPDRSALSLDGGLTWDRDRLGRDGNLNGEYLVRLNLKRHPASGWVESEVVDLWLPGPEAKLARPVTIKAVKLSAETDGSLIGTSVELFGRFGPTPQFDPASWTAWAPADELAAGKAHGRKLSEGRVRFGQWRAILRTQVRSGSKRLRAVKLDVASSAEPAAKMTLSRITITQPPRVRGGVRFVHAPRDKRLKLLREKFKIDEIVKDCTDEFDAMATLARWIARKTNIGNHKPGTLFRDMPDYDAFLAMELADRQLVHGMCVHEAAAFVQFATALGLPARRSIWSHAIAEVWLNGHGKWATFDASGGFGYALPDRKGASFTDIANAWGPNGVGKIYKVDPGATGTKRRQVKERDVKFFSRPWFIMRSNFLETNEPGEPGHGSYTFKYNGDLRYQHPLKAPLPWFDFYSRRLGDFNFTCNQAYLFPARTSVAGNLQVVLDHDMPNFARFERRIDGGEWTRCESEFDWTVRKGANVLEVRPLNAWQADAIDSGDAAKAKRTLRLLPPIVSKVEAVRE